jgi:hypothetical protein
MKVKRGAETCSPQLQFDYQSLASGFPRTQKDGGPFASDRVVKNIASSEHNRPSATPERARIHR